MGMVLSLTRRRAVSQRPVSSVTWGRSLGGEGQLDLSVEVVALAGPGEEGSGQPPVGAGLGEPVVDVGLDGGLQVPAVTGELVEQLGHGVEGSSGVVGAVRRRFAGGCAFAQPGQDLPSQPGPHGLAVAGIGDAAGEVGLEEPLEAFQAAVLVGQGAHGDEQGPQTFGAAIGAGLVEGIVGERDLAGGETGEDLSGGAGGQPAAHDGRVVRGGDRDPDGVQRLGRMGGRSETAVEVVGEGAAVADPASRFGGSAGWFSRTGGSDARLVCRHWRQRPSSVTPSRGARPHSTQVGRGGPVMHHRHRPFAGLDLRCPQEGQWVAQRRQRTTPRWMNNRSAAPLQSVQAAGGMSAPRRRSSARNRATSGWRSAGTFSAGPAPSCRPGGFGGSRGRRPCRWSPRSRLGPATLARR